MAALLAAFALIGFLVVPPIAKAKLEEQLSQALQRRVTVGSVHANPFVPSIAVRHLAVREREGDAPFAGFDELYVNIAWTSIFRLAPVVDEIRLNGPRLRIVRRPDGTYNVQDLLDEFLRRPPSDAPTPGFALFNIELLDGDITFDDQAEGAKHALTELRIGIPFLSSLDAHRTVRVVPELSAKLNGAAIGVKGEALPFAEARTTSVNLNLDGYDLTRLATYVPFEPKLRLLSAALDARLELHFQQAPGKPPQVLLRGGTALRNLKVADLQDRPLLAWQRLAIELAEVAPLVPSASLRSVTLDGAEVDLRRDRAGHFDVEGIAAAFDAWRGKRPPAVASKNASAPVSVRVDRIAVNAAKLRLSDASVSPAFTTTVDEWQLEVNGLDTASDKRAELKLAARTAAGETIKVEAQSALTPIAGQGRVELSGVALKRYQPYVDKVARALLDDGRVDLHGTASWTPGEAADPPRFKVEDAGLRLTGLRARLPGERQPFLRVGVAAIEGASADPGARSIALGKIALDNVVARARREKDGTLDLAKILLAEATSAAKGKPNVPPAGTDKPWRIELGELTLERGAVGLEDQAVATPVALDLSAIRIKAQRFSNARGQRGTVSVRATVNKTGSLEASGPVSVDPLQGSLEIAARSVGFAQVQPYLDDRLNFTITSGAVSAKGRATFSAPAAGAFHATYKGDLSVTEFASVDKRLTQDLLKWKALSLGAIDFDLEPLKVSLDEIALADFYARIILAAEGRLNLQDLIAKPGGAATPATAGAAAAAADTAATAPASPSGVAAPAAGASTTLAPGAAATPAAPLQNVRIGRITLQGGNVNFSDFYIKPNYSANLTGVAGLVTEMSPAKAGDVELRGKIDDAAPVELLGSVNPLAADLFLDLKASARDIELPPLSPYAVKYAGYGISRGKLSMNVKYRIENRKLAAENNIYLDQLTFGEKVESPTATQLPVTLAVALLKDRSGVIDINLPISGSLDDPQFSLGGIIVKVIVNLIVKAVTAPFALLGSLFGGGEELAYLEFAPGQATLGDGAEAKLKNLAKALTERPGLRLDIAGRADPAADREGLKRVALRRAVRTQKFNELRSAGEAPASADAVTVEATEYEKYLRRAYGDAKFAKPRNAIGLTKDLPVPDMEALMLANTPVDDDALRLLANARAQATKAWLTGEGKVTAERIFIVAPKLTAGDIKDKGRPTRVDFALK